MAPVVGIDPQGVMIDVHVVSVPIVGELVPTIVRLIERRTADIDVIQVARVDSNLAVVHRPRIEAVDTSPTVTAIGRLKDATKVLAILSLLVDRVLKLSTEANIERTSHSRASFALRPPALSLTFVLWPRSEGQFDVEQFAITRHLQRDLVLGDVPTKLRQ